MCREINGETCEACPLEINQPVTDDGLLAWSVIRNCRWQLRVGMAGAYGLDMGAVLAVADAMEARTPLLAEILPSIEAVLVATLRSPAEDE